MTAATSFRFVALLGLMGVGKTTVGRALAARVGWRLSDSDEQIQARIAAQLEARESLFRSVAGLTLETGGATAAELADAIIVRLQPS